jgi:hypothetical protein
LLISSDMIITSLVLLPILRLPMVHFIFGSNFSVAHNAFSRKLAFLHHPFPSPTQTTVPK